MIRTVRRQIGARKVVWPVLLMAIIFSAVSILGTVSIGVVAAQGSESNPGENLIRTSGGNGVYIEAELLQDESASGNDALVFELSITTHSGDLSNVDFSEIAVLANDSGVTLNKGITSTFLRKSSHHLVVEIRVSKDAIEKSGLLNSGANSLELRLMNLRGYDHKFVWDIEQLRNLVRLTSPGYYAYVTNASEGTLSVIDPETYEVIRTISLGGEASHGIAVSPDGRYVFAGTLKDGDIVVLDAWNEFRKVASFDAKARAHGIDISPDGSTVLVGSGGSSDEPNLVVIDVPRLKLVKRITEGILPPGHIDFSPDGKYLYISNLDNDKLTVLNADTFKVEKVISVGDGPNESRASADGKYVYVANWESNDVSVIDVASLEMVDTIPSGEGTHGIAVSPDSRQVWTANRISNDISVIDAGTRQVVRRLDAGKYANHITFSPSGNEVWVSNARDNTVIVIDSGTFDVKAEIKVGSEPHEIDFGLRPGND